ncbi:hypothetical protein FRB95_002613 [Tulasnella sp. JGI-2019a]|nr:hypothetical protein FRB95_002613 [Tulasnella sp. JGI-2019a]
MARYAYGCLKGAALRWHESLEPNVQNSWSNLRQAMIDRFPPMELVPDAPAAALAPDLALSSPASRCRVLVVRCNGSVVGYMGPLALHGDSYMQKSPDGALTLDVPIERRTHQGGFLIRLLPPGQQSVAYPFLGVTYHGDQWQFRACDSGRPGKVFNDRARAYTSIGGAVAASKIWSIKVDKSDTTTEELCIQWIDDKGTHIPIVTCTRPENVNSESGSGAFWMRKTLESRHEPLRLILERF